ncbi:MAG: hypothetical protein ICV85_02620 [Tolypothrix sp. T3-bin4]|nr:hypothetical protein [Tolypothrix sp. T3-bin4]
MERWLECENPAIEKQALQEGAKIQWGMNRGEVPMPKLFEGRCQWVKRSNPSEYQTPSASELHCQHHPINQQLDNTFET